MPRFGFLAALFGVLSLSACVTPPPVVGPTVMALPPQGKSMTAFQQDDVACRQYSVQQTGGASPAAAAQQSQVNSAALGTAIGAAAGALIGSTTGNVGAGAAIGAGGGLLAGSAVGANAAEASAANVQQSYNMAYTQCMASKGDPVAAPAPAPVPVYAYPYAYPRRRVYVAPYAYPYPY